MEKAVYDALSSEIEKESDVQIQIDSFVRNKEWHGDPHSDLAVDFTDDIYEANIFQVRFYALGDQNDLLFKKEYYNLEAMAYDVIPLMEEFPQISIDDNYDLGEQIVDYLNDKKGRLKF